MNISVIEMYLVLSFHIIVVISKWWFNRIGNAVYSFLNLNLLTWLNYVYLESLDFISENMFEFFLYILKGFVGSRSSNILIEIAVKNEIFSENYTMY